MPHNSVCEIVEKIVPSMTVASVRWKGAYAKTGEVVKKLGIVASRNISGHPMNLYYELEFNDDDANVETCFPIKGNIKAEGVVVRALPGGRCVSFVHEGPYEGLKDSYKLVFDYIKLNNLKVVLPCREIFIEGPGIVFKRNPVDYVTELQFFVE